MIIMENINTESLKAALNTSSILGKMDAEASMKQMVEVSQNEALLGNKTNLTAALVGVGLAVGLELVSSNGNKLSAATAAVVGGGLVYAARNPLQGYQSTGTAVVSALVAYKASAIAGRTIAAYFPKTNVVERIVEVPVQGNVE